MATVTTGVRSRAPPRPCRPFCHPRMEFSDRMVSTERILKRRKMPQSSLKRLESTRGANRRVSNVHQTSPADSAEEGVVRGRSLGEIASPPDCLTVVAKRSLKRDHRETATESDSGPGEGWRGGLRLGASTCRTDGWLGPVCTASRCRELLACRARKP